MKDTLNYTNRELHTDWLHYRITTMTGDQRKAVLLDRILPMLSPEQLEKLYMSITS